MFTMCGYNFCLDKNAIDPTPTNVADIESVKIQNGIFDHFNMTRDVSKEYSSEIPTAWDFFTIMNCNFNGTIYAGNIDFTLNTVDKLRIKRRKVGTFDWLVLTDIPIKTIDDFSFSILDNLNENYTEYEYAFVPVLNEIEGNYIKNTVTSEFDGVFICDYDTIFKFYSGVSYGNLESVQKVGIQEPVGSKYPIVIANANTDYNKGSISGTILNTDYENTGKIDREAIVQYQKLLTDFFKNKRAKILKDWNGASYLMCITGNPIISYNNSYGMGIADFSAEWIEQGEVDNQLDLYRNGLVKVVE